MFNCTMLALGASLSEASGVQSVQRSLLQMKQFAEVEYERLTVSWNG